MTDGPTRPDLNTVEQATVPLDINCGEYIAVLGHVLDGQHDLEKLFAFTFLDSLLPSVLIDRRHARTSSRYDQHTFTMVKMAILRYCREHEKSPSHFLVTDIFIGYYPINKRLPRTKDHTHAQLVYKMIDKVHYDTELLTELGFYDKEIVMSDPTPLREPEDDQNEGPQSWDAEEES